MTRWTPPDVDQEPWSTEYEAWLADMGDEDINELLDKARDDS
jgi:hypothetical protein